VITYTDGGIDNRGYYSGKLASVSTTLKKADGVNLPQTVKYQVDYDMSGRVSRADCFWDGQPHPDWSIEDTIQYDKNGNIEFINGQRVAFAEGKDQIFSITDDTEGGLSPNPD
jgi:hypothetical protein